VRLRRTQRERSRRCLLLVGLLFLVGQLGVGLMLDWALPKIRFTDADNMVKGVAGLSRPPDIMFMGSSRFLGAIDIGELDKLMQASRGQQAPLLFNAAIPAADAFAMDYLLRLLISHGITPGMVVVEISPETVKVWGPWLDIQIARLITWQDMPDALPDFIARRRISRLLSSRLIPLYLYRKELLTWMIGSPPPYLTVASAATSPQPNSGAGVEELGPPPAPEPGPSAMVAGLNRLAASDTLLDPQQELDAAIKKSQSQAPMVASWLRDYRIGGINAQHLESMLALLRDRKVPVILVGAPVCKLHFARYTPEINRKFLDYMAYLSRTYGCLFVDYRDRVPDEFFRDTYHVTKAGGLFFSRMFAREVLSEVWLRPPSSPQGAAAPTARDPLAPAPQAIDRSPRPFGG
jgi:hypothetical protein